MNTDHKYNYSERTDQIVKRLKVLEERISQIEDAIEHLAYCLFNPKKT